MQLMAAISQPKAGNYLVPASAVVRPNGPRTGAIMALTDRSRSVQGLAVLHHSAADAFTTIEGSQRYSTAQPQVREPVCYAMLIELALPPAAAVLMLRERSTTSLSAGTRVSPGSRPVKLTMGPGRSSSDCATAKSVAALPWQTTPSNRTDG